MTATSSALLQSFLDGPILVRDLPEASVFPFGNLSLPESVPKLNTQQKLGHLCEDAFSTLLKATSKYELLAQNLQIQQDVHTTVGELDFLLRDLGSGQLIHLELATKFYLSVPTKNGLTLPGPDAHDNYFKKLQHLRDHQLRITEQHHDVLPEQYHQESIVPQQLIYGCLFDHIHCTKSASPKFINPHRRRGRWLTIDECSSHFPQDTYFQIIPKHLWPIPLKLLKDIPLETWTPQTPVERCIMLRINNHPVPYFVTPSGYPQRV